MLNNLVVIRVESHGARCALHWCGAWIRRGNARGWLVAAARSLPCRGWPRRFARRHIGASLASPAAVDRAREKAWQVPGGDVERYRQKALIFPLFGASRAFVARCAGTRARVRRPISPTSRNGGSETGIGQHELWTARGSSCSASPPLGNSCGRSQVRGMGNDERALLGGWRPLSRATTSCRPRMSPRAACDDAGDRKFSTREVAHALRCTSDAAKVVQEKKFLRPTSTTGIFATLRCDTRAKCEWDPSRTTRDPAAQHTRDSDSRRRQVDDPIRAL